MRVFRGDKTKQGDSFKKNSMKSSVIQVPIVTETKKI